MSLLHEIRNQPPALRRAMYWLAVIATLGGIGFWWLSSVERDMFFAIHSDSTDREAFVAQQDAQVPQPLAMIGKAFGTMTASIGSFLGFDSSRGFDKSSQHDTVHLLPLSK